MSKTQKHIPLRMCIACREMKPKDELFRIVGCEDGKIDIDENSKAQCRGAYICKNEKCVLTAQKRSCLERVFRQKIDRTVYDELLERSKTE